MKTTLLTLVLALCSTTQAQQPVHSNATYRYAPGELLVMPQPGRATTLRDLLAEHDLTILETDAISGLLRVAVPNQQEELWQARLAAAAAVRYAERNGLGQGGLIPNDTYWTSLWHLRNTGQNNGTAGADIRATDAWDVTTGWNGVTIAVLDTGIDSDHPEFVGRIDPDGYDFVNQDPNPEADHPHGSQVSGVMCANADNNFGVTGVDWNCNVLPIKVLNANNGGNTFDLAQALNYCATQADVQVISMSLINYPGSNSLINALQGARNAGKILLACAGNFGIGNANVSFPGASPLTISIGSTDNRDERPNWSATGSALDFVAPGDDVPTVAHNTSANLFGVVSGCSFATPITAGVVGLALARANTLGIGTLTHDQVFELLRAGAVDQVGPPNEDTPGRDDFFGWGRIDARLVVDAVASLDVCLPGNIGLGAGGPFDVLFVNGESFQGITRTVQVPANASSSMSMSVPPMMPIPAPFPPLFLLWARFGDLSTAMPFQLPLGIGEMCFSPGDPSTFVTLAEAAPWVAPTGVLPLGSVLTLQGIILADAMGNIGVTNAITIEPIAFPPPTINFIDPFAAPAGTLIEIHGSDFQSGASLTLDGQPVPPVTASDTLITFVAPSAPCDASLVVTNPDGQSATETFQPTPTITNIVPVGGTPSTGGTNLLIVGSGFAPNTTVTVGGSPMTLTSSGPTLLIGILPPGSVGAAAIVVMTPNGCTTSSSITYTP